VRIKTSTRKMDDFTQYLMSRKPIVVGSKEITQVSKNGMIFRSTRPSFVVPPLNTDIRFMNFLPAAPYQVALSSFTSKPLRETFSWHLPDVRDDQLTRFKKSLIQPVQSQYLCG
jgi:hypothetical protein